MQTPEGFKSRNSKIISDFSPIGNQFLTSDKPNPQRDKMHLPEEELKYIKPFKTSEEELKAKSLKSCTKDEQANKLNDPYTPEVMTLKSYSKKQTTKGRSNMSQKDTENVQFSQRTAQQFNKKNTVNEIKSELSFSIEESDQRKSPGDSRAVDEDICQICGNYLEQHHEDYNFELMEIIYKFEKAFQTDDHPQQDAEDEVKVENEENQNLLNAENNYQDNGKTKKTKKMMKIMRKRDLFLKTHSGFFKPDALMSEKNECENSFEVSQKSISITRKGHKKSFSHCQVKVPWRYQKLLNSSEVKIRCQL